MGKATVTAGSNGKQAPALTLVQVQTLAGNVGVQALYNQVQAAVKAYNATAPKGGQHVCVQHMALANNTKGMQWQLALLATVARQHGCTMVRLGVHGGAVALCGPQANVAALAKAFTAMHNVYGTMAANATQNQTGNRVSFSNAYLCGCPAGLQIAAKITPTLAYGIGYLFAFAAPTNSAAYAAGQQAAANAYKPTAKPAATTAKPAATQPAQAASAQPAPVATQPAQAAS